jgi:hypothetical protein
MTRKKKDSHQIVQLKDPELEMHKQMFLGKPGSKKYREFVKSWREAKARIIGTPSKGATRRRMNGGAKGRIRLFAKADEKKMRKLLDFANMSKWFTGDEKLEQEEYTMDENTETYKTVRAQNGEPKDQVTIDGIPPGQMAPDAIRYRFKKNGQIDRTPKGVLSEREIYKKLLPFLMKLHTQLEQQMERLSDRDTSDAYQFTTDNLMFVTELLREINLYANPIWFDDLYYYYYYMRLDKVLGPMMKIFNRLKAVADEKPKNREQGMDFIMRTYPSRENDLDIDNQLVSRVIPFFDVKQRNALDSNIRGINHFLNAMHLGPYTPMLDEKTANLVIQQGPRKEPE